MHLNADILIYRMAIRYGIYDQWQQNTVTILFNRIDDAALIKKTLNHL